MKYIFEILILILLLRKHNLMRKGVIKRLRYNMNPTSHCELLMNLLLKNNCIKHPKELTKTTIDIITRLYADLKEADTTLKVHKKQKGLHFYDLKLAKI